MIIVIPMRYLAQMVAESMPEACQRTSRRNRLRVSDVGKSCRSVYATRLDDDEYIFEPGRPP